MNTAEQDALLFRHLSLELELTRVVLELLAKCRNMNLDEAIRQLEQTLAILRAIQGGASPTDAAKAAARPGGK